MTEDARRALLPAGLRDVLPPYAEQRAQVTARLLALFRSHGYSRVDPPLVEFEESLLGTQGGGDSLARQTFRLMDPASGRMMGVRADMTVQVARIAATRLAHEPRPLRLCYAGDVLRASASALKPDRHFQQIGAEIIGSPADLAEIEAVELATAALTCAGLSCISVDLNAPPLVPAILAAMGLAEDRDLRAALERKDFAAVGQLGGPAAPVLQGLLTATGPARAALGHLATVPLPPAATPIRDQLRRVAEGLLAADPDLRVTIDPVENRGFEYYTGVGFSLFAQGARLEVGRGGRYASGVAAEPAAGFTLFMDMLARALPDAQPAPRCLLAVGTPRAVAAAYHAKGWVTVAQLDPAADPLAEAARLDCACLWAGAEIPVPSQPSPRKRNMP